MSPRKHARKKIVSKSKSRGVFHSVFCNSKNKLVVSNQKNAYPRKKLACIQELNETPSQRSDTLFRVGEISLSTHALQIYAGIIVSTGEILDGHRNYLFRFSCMNPENRNMQFREVMVPENRLLKWNRRNLQRKADCAEAISKAVGFLMGETALTVSDSSNCSTNFTSLSSEGNGL